MSIRDATEVFSEWALRDRDKGMEIGHDKSVNELYKRNDKQINSLILIINPLLNLVVTVIHADKSKKLRWN